MALIKCTECGREISDKAQTCTGCGAPVTDSNKDSLNERDSFFIQAAEIVVQTQQGSASLIQRRLKLGYNHASRIIDQLEAAKIIGPFEGDKAREVLVLNQFSLENLLNGTHSNAQTDFYKASPNKRDSRFNQVAVIVVQTQQGTAKLIQGRVKGLFYSDLCEIFDQLESAGIIGPYQDSKPREVLIKDASSLHTILNDPNPIDKTQYPQGDNSESYKKRKDFLKKIGFDGKYCQYGDITIENNESEPAPSILNKPLSIQSKPPTNPLILIVFVIIIVLFGFYFFNNSSSTDNSSSVAGKDDNGSSSASTPLVEATPTIEAKPVINYHQLGKEDLAKTEKELITMYKTQWDSIKRTNLDGIPQFKTYYEEVGKIITDLANLKKEYAKEFPKLVKLHTTLIGSKKFNQALEDYFKFGQPYSHTYLTTPCESALEKLVKDPSSLDIISSEVQGRNKNGWVVLIKYRSKNSYGAIVPGGTQFVLNYSEGSDTYDVTNVINNY